MPVDGYLADGGRSSPPALCRLRRRPRRDYPPARPASRTTSAATTTRSMAASSAGSSRGATAAARASRAGPGLLPRAVRAPGAGTSAAGASRCTSSASRRGRESRGQPTPEGLHRDGVDDVLVLLIRRRNIKSGTTTIHALDRQLLGRLRLGPFDAALVHDARVYHGATPVEPLDPSRPAYRDVPRSMRVQLFLSAASTNHWNNVWPRPSERCSAAVTRSSTCMK